MTNIYEDIKRWIANGFRAPKAARKDIEIAQRHIHNLSAEDFRDRYGYIKLCAWIAPDHVDKGVSAREMLALFEAEALRRRK